MTRVVPDQDLLATATETAQKLAAKPSWRAASLQETHEAEFARAARAGDENRERGVRRAGALRRSQGSVHGVPRKTPAGLQQNHESGNGCIGFCERTDMEQGRGNISAIPHEMLGTRTETMRTAQTGILWRVAATRMPTRWGMFQRHWIRARDLERQPTGRNRAGNGHGRSDRRRSAGAHPFAVLHRRGARVAALRLQRSARDRHAGHRRGRARPCDLRISGGPRHRPDGEAAGLRAAGRRPRHVDANHALGFKGDCRDFSLPAAILHDLGISRVRLLTNNPRKAVALADAGIEVVARIPCEVAPTPYSLAYLRTKKEKMGHALSLRGNKGDNSAHFGGRGSIFVVGEENRASNAGWRVQGIEAQL